MLAQAIQSEKRVWVPSIDGRRAHSLFGRIKPVVRFLKIGDNLLRSRSPRGILYYIERADLSASTYFYNARPEKEAPSLKELCEIRTYHPFSHPRVFAPVVEEVLAQIPMGCLGKVIAFEIVDFIPKSRKQSEEDRKAFREHHHAAITRLYAKE